MGVKFSAASEGVLLQWLVLLAVSSIALCRIPSCVTDPAQEARQHTLQWTNGITQMPHRVGRPCPMLPLCMRHQLHMPIIL